MTLRRALKATGLAALGFAASLLAPSSLQAQALSRQEIENAHRYEKHADPAFVSVAPAALPKSIRVTAGRSYAVFGYNTPAVLLWLPAADNGAYAVVKFDAKPVDAGGKELPHEIEEGLYDNEKHMTQVRFTAPGGKGLVPLARASGRISVKYPVAIRTVSIRPGSPEALRLGISVDGPFVKYRSDALALPEAAAFTGVEPLRGYDAAGKRLERYGGIQKSEFADGVSTRTVAFWGPVASVRFDVVEKWSEVEIPFDVPAAPLRPVGKEGLQE